MPARRLFRSLSFGVALCVAALIGSPACSGTPSFDGTDAGTGGSDGACVVADKSLCGVTCDTDNNCAAGLFCDTTDTCQAECIAGETASEHCNGAPCANNGRCIGNTGSGGTPAGSGGGFNPPPGSGGLGGMGGGCIDVEVTPTPIIPNVALLIDRSLSMTGATGYQALVQDAITAGEYTPWECTGPVAGAPGGAGDAEFWRWNVVRTVLFNDVDGIVTELGNSVRFGLTTYSNDSSVPETCPVLVNVDLGFDNRDAMLGGFACSDLIFETPTRESLAPTADALATLDVEGPKFIILATDGAPDTCACPNFGGGQPEPCDAVGAQEAEQANVVTEAARVHDELGITLHVIDVSSPTETSLHDHLTQVAAAGGGDIYDGTDPAGLIQAFRDIISEAQSCLIELNGSVVPGKEALGTVTMGGEELDFEEDWIMPTPSQIELVGEACMTFKTENPTLQIEFPCDTFVVK